MKLRKIICFFSFLTIFDADLTFASQGSTPPYDDFDDYRSALQEAPTGPLMPDHFSMLSQFSMVQLRTLENRVFEVPIDYGHDNNNQRKIVMNDLSKLIQNLRASLQQKPKTFNLRGEEWQVLQWDNMPNNLNQEGKLFLVSLPNMADTNASKFLNIPFEQFWAHFGYVTPGQNDMCHLFWVEIKKVK